MPSDYAKKKAAKKKEAVKVKMGKKPGQVKKWPYRDPSPDQTVETEGKKDASKSIESGVEKTAEGELCQQMEEKAKTS